MKSGKNTALDKLAIKEDTRSIEEVMQTNSIDNAIWKKRSTISIVEMFRSPAKFYEAVNEYCQWAVDNPKYEKDFRVVNRELKEIDVPKERVFTHRAFALFCGLPLSAVSNFKKRLNDLEPSIAQEFRFALDYLDDVVYTNKYEGAVSGFFKEGIIKDDLGIASKTLNENINWSAGPMTTEDVKRISQQLESDY